MADGRAANLDVMWRTQGLASMGITVVAAIQLQAVLADVGANLSKVASLVRQASEQHATIVALPEFFTSAMAFNPAMEEVARLDMEFNIPRCIAELASRYSCIIAGSYLNIISGDIYNSMQLQFPDGQRFIHNKDIPTQFENRYYTNGDTVRSCTGIGVVMCWEMLRSQTIQQLTSGARIVLAGSCWWDLPPDNGDSDLRNYNHQLNRTTPAAFARTLGVPVVHGSHVGVVMGCRNSNSDEVVSRQLIGTTQIVDQYGNVRAQADVSDGDTFIVEEVDIPDSPRASQIPNGFWAQRLPSQYVEAWYAENQAGQRYYQSNRQRMVGEFAT